MLNRGKKARSLNNRRETEYPYKKSSNFKAILRAWLEDEEQQLKALGCSPKIWRKLLPLDLRTGEFMAVFANPARFLSELDSIWGRDPKNSDVWSKRGEAFSRSSRAATVYTAMTTMGIQSGFALGYTAREIGDRLDFKKLADPFHRRFQSMRARRRRQVKLNTQFIHRACKYAGPSLNLVLAFIEKNWEDLVQKPPKLPISKVQVTPSNNTCLHYFNTKTQKPVSVSLSTVEAAITQFRKKPS